MSELIIIEFESVFAVSPVTLPPATLERLLAIGNAVAADRGRLIVADNHHIADLANALELVISIVRRAKACGGKESEDEQQ